MNFEMCKFLNPKSSRGLFCSQVVKSRVCVTPAW